MTLSTKMQPDQILDATGATCPGPLLEAKRLVDNLKPGEVLRLISDCPGTEADLRAWTRQTGRTLLDVETLDGRRLAFTILNGDPWPASYVVDVRGSRCPTPVIEAERQLAGMSAGETLKLLSDCTSVDVELETWSRHTGHQILAMLPGPDGCTLAYLQP